MSQFDDFVSLVLQTLDGFRLEKRRELGLDALYADAIKLVNGGAKATEQIDAWKAITESERLMAESGRTGQVEDWHSLEKQRTTLLACLKAFVTEASTPPS
jgi:hypothetical protein